jgi:DNA processing protein
MAVHEAPPPAIRRVARGTPEYPRGLDDLPDPPAFLYVEGAWSAGPAVALVGSRAASPYGLAQARRLAGDLASLGVVVVSGLARGIDAAAHEGALERQGTTVAVLPGGLDAVTPRHHADLARRVARRGALVSECASGEPRWRGAFVTRNRLIAALADATVVVEAAETSGALSTAAAARRLGRALLAVPGDVDRATSAGTLALLRSGADVCGSAADVLAALDRARGAPRPRRAGPRPASATNLGARPASAPIAGARPASAEARLAAALGARPATLEQLVAASGLGAAEALAALLHLEWSGVARALPGQRWVRAGAA